MSLIPFILTLSIISSRYQFGYILPICRIEVRLLDTAFDTVSLDSPIEEFGLVFIPVTLRCILPIKIIINQKIYRLEFWAINR